MAVTSLRKATNGWVSAFCHQPIHLILVISITPIPWVLTAPLPGASPWMLASSSAGTVIGHVHETDGYGGVGANNGQVYNPPTIGAPLTETIVLNTQAAAWTTTFFVNGVNIGSTYTFSSGNPSIAYVGVENAIIDGTISDFTLSTPEPASLGLLGLGGVAGLLLLKRRRIA